METFAMPTKRGWIVLLAGINLILLFLLLASVVHLPRALAQGGGRSGGFVCVAAKPAGQSYDVLYALDVPNRKLHAFRPDSQQGRPIVHAGFRDLAADFGRDSAKPAAPKEGP